MTKNREGFKEVEGMFIPINWNLEKLRDICKINPESISPKEDSNRVIKYIDIESVSTGRINNLKEMRFGDSPSRARRVVKKSDIIVSTVRPYLKAFAPVEGYDNNLICSTGFAVLRTNEEYCDYKYLFQVTLSDLFMNQLITKMVGSNYPAVNSSDLSNTYIPVPPLQEQKRISEILSTVDEHIEKLDKTIEDYQLLKKGMMKKLMTEGIGHTEFKETEMGRIPKEWKVLKLGEIGRFRKGKGIKKDDLISDGLPCIRYGEIYTTYNHIAKKIKSFISEKTATDSVSISYGHIVFAGSGETIEDIGKAIVYLNNEPCYVGGDTIIMEPCTEVDSTYLAYFLSSNIVTKQKRKLGQGNSVVHIYSDGLKTVSVCIPGKEEQKRIAFILQEIDIRIELYQQQREDFTQLKKALMQKLLTGKIRVNQ